MATFDPRTSDGRALQRLLDELGRLPGIGPKSAQRIAYHLLEADIEEDPSQSGPDQRGGKVAYYVDTQDKVDALVSTGLFNIAQVGNTNKWYVELKDSTTPAAAIAEKIAGMNLSVLRNTSENHAISVALRNVPIPACPSR